MKNLLMLFVCLSMISFSCKDDDDHSHNDDNYEVTININNPTANSTHNVSEMIPLEVVFSRGAEEVIHHVKIELVDSDGNVVEEIYKDHVHEAGSHTYSKDDAFSINDAGTYTIKASSHDMEDHHAEPTEITIMAQ